MGKMLANGKFVENLYCSNCGRSVLTYAGQSKCFVCFADGIWRRLPKVITKVEAASRHLHRVRRDPSLRTENTREEAAFRQYSVDLYRSVDPQEWLVRPFGDLRSVFVFVEGFLAPIHDVHIENGDIEMASDHELADLSSAIKSRLAVDEARIYRPLSNQH